MKKLTLIIALLTLTGFATSYGQADEIKADVALIKKNLAESMAKLKKYEWIETVTAFYKGEQKSVKQFQCYYSVDGKLTKVATGATQAAKAPGGLRGKIAENKKEEMGDYIEKALEKIKGYIPPQPEKIQQVYAGGNAGVKILEPGKKFKLEFPDYLAKGDLLSISIDRPNKLLTGYAVNTYVEAPADAVSFVISLKTLPDGTQYPADVTFNAPSKEVKIVMETSGYKVGAGK